MAVTDFRSRATPRKAWAARAVAYATLSSMLTSGCERHDQSSVWSMAEVDTAPLAMPPKPLPSVPLTLAGTELSLSVAPDRTTSIKTLPREEASNEPSPRNAHYATRPSQDLIVSAPADSASVEHIVAPSSLGRLVAIEPATQPGSHSLDTDIEPQKTGGRFEVALNEGTTHAAVTEETVVPAEAISPPIALKSAVDAISPIQEIASGKTLGNQLAHEITDPLSDLERTSPVAAMDPMIPEPEAVAEPAARIPGPTNTLANSTQGTSKPLHLARSMPDDRAYVSQISAPDRQVYVSQLQLGERQQLAIRIDGRVAGQIQFAASQGRIEIHLGQVLDVFKSYIEPAHYNTLRNSKAASEFVSLEKIQGAGINIRYNAAYDELVLDT